MTATSADEQLCLSVDFPSVELETAQVIDIVETLLQHHRGDCRAVIRELLLDADPLRNQLYTASHLMSHGMGRGWRPQYERV